MKVLTHNDNKASYNRKFVECFAIRSVPLYALLKKGANFVWSNNCEKGFVFSKEQSSNGEILGHPFALQTDASNERMGFVLTQVRNGISNQGSLKGVTDKELLAVFYAMKNCVVYLLGHLLIVYSDHKPLS